MCGICGEISFKDGNSPQKSTINKINHSMIHRGPDAGRVDVIKNVAFGHRRLSILDLTTASEQPFYALGGRVMMTYNGEIYNYKELRDDLVSHGYSFETSGDTEVLLKAYLHWGSDCVHHLNGMFAFGIYDFRTDIFMAARDPVGQKPFNYFMDEYGFVFASEVRALLCHERVNKELNHSSVLRLLTGDGIEAPYSILKDVRKLKPGHILRLDVKKNTIKELEYWNPTLFKPKNSISNHLSENVVLEELQKVLSQSVAQNLRSDAPLGIYLSGGIDSSTILKFACDTVGAENIHTFTISSDITSFDESHLARKTAQNFGTQHQERLITGEGALQVLPDLLDSLDEPLADPGLLAIYQVSRFAAEKVKVVLSGDGGDEFFYGYEPFLKWRLANNLAKLPNASYAGFFRKAISLFPADYRYMSLRYKALIFLKGLSRPKSVRNFAWIGGFTPEEAKSVLKNGELMTDLMLTPHGVEKMYERVDKLFRDWADEDELTKLGYQYQTNYLPDLICSHTDKASMSVSIEARSPFLDKNVMQFANQLPTKYKINGGVGKWILRRQMEQWPELSHINKMKKRGYTTPLALWLKNDLRLFVEKTLEPDLIRKCGIFNEDEVSKLWSQHKNGKENLTKKLWPIILVQDWWQRNILEV